MSDTRFGPNGRHLTLSRSARFVRPRCEVVEHRLLFAVEAGIQGNYYDNADFTGLSFTRDDPTIDFDWQTRAPLARMSPTTYSVRWAGQLRPATSGAYIFTVDADAATTLRVRGETLPLQPDGQGHRSASVNLWGGQVIDLSVEYSHAAGSARVSLKWTPPGTTTSVDVPRSALVNSFSPPPNSLQNPIIGAGADPWVVRWHDEYIYVYSDGGRILGSRSPRLQDIGMANPVVLYAPPAGTAYSFDLWAPELHRLDDKWYLYFAADNGSNANHHMYVAELNADNPLGTFTNRGALAATTDRWAIDGTVLELNGNRYFVWSGWPGFTDGQQNLYIARMSSPTTLTGDRVRIAAPTYSWEQSGLPINEGPEVLQHNGATNIIYSGSGYWTNEYALGQLTLTGTDPMLASSWTKKSTPVFSQANGVTGTGHASFVSSPDGTEDWIVYHAHKYSGSFNEDRVVRTQPFTWNTDGSPNFGLPVANGTLLDEPSGTPVLYAPTFVFLGKSSRARATRDAWIDAVMVTAR